MHAVLCADHVGEPQARAEKHLPEAQPVGRDEFPVGGAGFEPLVAEHLDQQPDQDDGGVHHVVVRETLHPLPVDDEHEDDLRPEKQRRQHELAKRQHGVEAGGPLGNHGCDGEEEKVRGRGVFVKRRAACPPGGWRGKKVMLPLKQAAGLARVLLIVMQFRHLPC